MKENNIAAAANIDEIFVESEIEFFEALDKKIEERNSKNFTKSYTCLGNINGYVPGSTEYENIPVYVDISKDIFRVYIGRKARIDNDYSTVNPCNIHSFLTKEMNLLNSYLNTATIFCEMIAKIYEYAYGTSIIDHAYDYDEDADLPF